MDYHWNNWATKAKKCILRNVPEWTKWQNSVKDRCKEPDNSGTDDQCKAPDFKVLVYYSEYNQ